MGCATPDVAPGRACHCPQFIDSAHTRPRRGTQRRCGGECRCRVAPVETTGLEVKEGHCVCVRVRVCVCVCMSVCLSAGQSFCLSVSQPLCLPVSLSAYVILLVKHVTYVSRGELEKHVSSPPICLQACETRANDAWVRSLFAKGKQPHWLSTQPLMEKKKGTAKSPTSQVDCRFSRCPIARHACCTKTEGC